MEDKKAVTGQKNTLMTVRELETNPAARERVRRLSENFFPTSEEDKAPQAHTSDSRKE
jgi:hypothetical protein